MSHIILLIQLVYNIYIFVLYDLREFSGKYTGTACKQFNNLYLRLFTVGLVCSVAVTTTNIIQ